MTILKPLPTTTVANIKNMLARLYPNEVIMIDLGEQYKTLWLVRPNSPWKLVGKEKNSQYNSLGII